MNRAREASGVLLFLLRPRGAIGGLRVPFSLGSWGVLGGLASASAMAFVFLDELACLRFKDSECDGALLGGNVQPRKRVFASAAATAGEAVTAAACKRQRRREEPSLDALPDECLFEVLRPRASPRVSPAAGSRSSAASAPPRSCWPRPRPPPCQTSTRSTSARTRTPRPTPCAATATARGASRTPRPRTSARRRRAPRPSRERLRPREPPDARRHRRRPLRARPRLPWPPLSCLRSVAGSRGRSSPGGTLAAAAAARRACDWGAGRQRRIGRKSW
ncbi:hypothetical protein ACP4OV_010985 [Aristida adscensionis]